MAWVVKRAKLNFKKVFFWDTLICMYKFAFAFTFSYMHMHLCTKKNTLIRNVKKQTFKLSDLIDQRGLVEGTSANTWIPRSHNRWPTPGAPLGPPPLSLYLQCYQKKIKRSIKIFFRSWEAGCSCWTYRLCSTLSYKVKHIQNHHHYNDHHYHYNDHLHHQT